MATGRVSRKRLVHSPRVIELVMAARGCTRKEALEFLKDLGIEAAQEGPHPAKPQHTERTERKKRRTARLLQEHARELFRTAATIVRLLVHNPSLRDRALELWDETVKRYSQFEKHGPVLSEETVTGYERFRAAVRELFRWAAEDGHERKVLFTASQPP